MLEIEIDHGHSVTMDLYHNDFVSRWADLFERTVAQCEINQWESFAFRLTEVQAQQRLITTITAINQFLQRPVIQVPSMIDWEDQQWYNYLHTRFEELSGPYGHPTRLFSIAPAHIQDAIRALNFLVHRLEIRPYADPPWYISFDKNCYQRLPLEPKDYEHFQSHIPSGQAFIHYAELGKTMIDLYKDGLAPDYAGLQNLHYYSAEISVNLGSDDIELFTQGFRDWAHANAVDITDPRLGIGIIPIGMVRNVDTARQIVYNGNSITHLGLKQENKHIYKGKK